MTKLCRKCALKTSPRPFFNFGYYPKTEALSRNSFENRYFERRLSKILKNLTLFFLFHPLHFYVPVSCWGKQIFKKTCHRFNAFSRNVNTIYWKTFSTDSGIYKLEKIEQGVRWNGKLRLLSTLCIGISTKFHLHFTLTF